MLMRTHNERVMRNDATTSGFALQPWSMPLRAHPSRWNLIILVGSWLHSSRGGGGGLGGKCDVNPLGDRDAFSRCDRAPEAVGSFLCRYRYGRPCRWVAVHKSTRAGEMQRSALGLGWELGLGEPREEK